MYSIMHMTIQKMRSAARRMDAIIFNVQVMTRINCCSRLICNSVCTSISAVLNAMISDGVGFLFVVFGSAIDFEISIDLALIAARVFFEEA